MADWQRLISAVNMEQHVGVQDILEARQAAGMTLEDVMSLENDEEGRTFVQTACSLHAIAQLSLRSSTN